MKNYPNGKGRRACNYDSGIWIPLPIPLWLSVNWAVRFTPISVKRKQVWIRNVNKHWKTSANGSDVIANVISANQHFASTFTTQIFKFRRHSCKLTPSFSAPSQKCLGEITHRLHGSRGLLLTITLYGSTPSLSVNHDHTTYNSAGYPILLLFGWTVAW